MSYGSDSISIKDAERVDCASIRQLALDANIDAWSESDYADEISRRDSFVLKATVNGDLTGFLVARIVPGDGEYVDVEIYNIAAQPLHRRRGVGSSLLANLLDRLTKRRVGNVWLEVRESNLEAISFYLRHGFIAEVTRPNFYSNPSENAVIMRLRLRHSEAFQNRNNA